MIHHLCVWCKCNGQVISWNINDTNTMAPLKDSGPSTENSINLAPVTNPELPSRQGGGKIAVWGGQIQLRKIAGKLRENCGKLRKIAEKLRKNCDVVSGPPEPSRCNNSGQVAQNSQNFTETNSLWAVQLQEAPLNITVELQHEPKAADVVIQFVLPL